ncbi:MAG: methyl-accepting chemotaxis protein, partial [Hydrogenimonas sp.]|nr:methyl-accepting chemotaxis protein [Hydrogenimonas sp.]
MNNISIRKILLGSFGVLILILLLNITFGLMAIKTSEKSISKIIESDRVIEDIAKAEKSFLKSTLWAEIYLLRGGDESLTKYGQFMAETKKGLNKLSLEVKGQKLSALVKEAARKINEFDALVKSGKSEEFLDVEKLHEKTIEILDHVHNKIAKTKKETLEKSHQTVLKDEAAMTLIAVVGFLAAIILALYISSFITKNLKTIEDAAAELASSDGDLTKRMPVIGKNEIGEVAKKINLFIEKAHNTILEAKNNGDENSSVAAELSATALEIGKRAEDEAALIADTSNRGEEVFETLEKAVATINRSEENV